MGENINLTVLGREVAFRAGADMERVRNAARLLEERFAELKLRGGQSREVLLMYLALGLADDVLQSQDKMGGVLRRVTAMLSQIENTH
ncbi:MAG: cell division protein ZapA [Desulfovibrio sp.]|nr:cell division protein ZapA [Desulfovibrio sp.]